MVGDFLVFLLGLATGLLIGGRAAWIIRSRTAEEYLVTARGSWQRSYDQEVSKAQALSDQTISLKISLNEANRLALVTRNSAACTETELESAKSRIRTLTEELTVARAERDDVSHKMNKALRYVRSARRQLDGLSRTSGSSQGIDKNRFRQAFGVHETLAGRQEPRTSEQDVEIAQKGVSPPADGEGDDLTEIAGIGKVYEAKLHKLGIFYFRQIAAIGSVEQSRVNTELRGFRRLIERDNWIGQAQELHCRKYGINEAAAEAN